MYDAEFGTEQKPGQHVLIYLTFHHLVCTHDFALTMVAWLNLYKSIAGKEPVIFEAYY